MFISSFFTIIGTIITWILWIIGIVVALFVLALICLGISSAVSAIKQRKQKFKPSRSHIKYTKRYRKNYKKKLKKNRAEKKCVSDCSVSGAAQTVQNSHYGSVDTSDNEKKHSLNKEIEFIRSLGNNTVRSLNVAVGNISSESSSAIEDRNYEDHDYEKHKDEAYYKIKLDILSKGERLLLSFLEKIIDPNKYLIVPQVHYDRYLEVNTDRDEKYQAISASKINTRSTDFGIETKEYKPVCYIEYDDDTHNREDRKKRDRFLAIACRKAGLARIVVSSREINSQIAAEKGSMAICKKLYKKFYKAPGNPLNLPSLTCPRCGKEFMLLTGDYGAFLSHGRDSECDNVNIFRK